MFTNEVYDFMIDFDEMWFVYKGQSAIVCNDLPIWDS